MKASLRGRVSPVAAILLLIWALLTLALLWPVIHTPHDTPPSRESPGSAPRYLVIAPQALASSASAWAAYRTSKGYQVEVILLPPSSASTTHIRDLILESFADAGRPFPFFVLLMGHAHPSSSHPGAFLPAAHFTVDTNEFSGWGADPIASDDGLAGISSTGVPSNAPPVFIGRVPIRTNAEGTVLLDRVRLYEETPPTGPGRARIELVLSNAGFGAEYDPIFDWALRTLIQEVVPDEYAWHILNGNPTSPFAYPIGSFPNEVARRLDSGALAVVYAGHGQPEMLAWAHSPDGARNRIFASEDAALIQDAHASLAIFTACSAGSYDLPGDDLSVVESIFLTPGGPIATYSSSAWINPLLNGRLLLDIFDALLQARPATLGQWAYLVEAGSDPAASRQAPIALLKGILPAISNGYAGHLLLSPARAAQALDVQNATYNLFGDPALQIAYPSTKIAIAPRWLWQPSKQRVEFTGGSNLPSGSEVEVSLEALPGDEGAAGLAPAGSIDRYLAANDPLVAEVRATVGPQGKFTGIISVPAGALSGRYLLRVAAVEGQSTFVNARPVYLGRPPLGAILKSAAFWWCVLGALLLSRVLPSRRSVARLPSSR